MIQQPGELSYFVSENEVASQKGILLLAAQAGSINRANGAVFDRLIEEIGQSSAAWVVINMRDVGCSIERTQFTAFAKLLKTIREKPAQLKLCRLHPDLKKSLQTAGLLRQNKLSNNLREALASLSAKVKE